MKYDRTDIAKGFMNVSSKHGKKKAVSELAALILEQRLHGQIEEIIQDISIQQAKQNGFVEVEVSTAFELSSGLRQKLETYVKSKTGASKVLIHETVDKTLLAGIRLTAPDLELDTSLKTKLTRLKA